MIQYPYFKIFLCAFLLFGLMSCSDPYPPFVFETVNFTLTNADNSGTSPVHDNDSVPKQAYSMEINLVSMLKNKSGTDINESEFENEDLVTDFKISCLTEYNGIPANLPLNGFFYFSEQQGIGRIIGPEMYHEIFFAANRDADEWGTTKNFILMSEPEFPGNYEFVVSAWLSDGRFLSDTVNVNLY